MHCTCAPSAVSAQISSIAAASTARRCDSSWFSAPRKLQQAGASRYGSHSTNRPGSGPSYGASKHTSRSTQRAPGWMGPLVPQVFSTKQAAPSESPFHARASCSTGAASQRRELQRGCSELASRAEGNCASVGVASTLLAASTRVVSSSAFGVGSALPPQAQASAPQSPNTVGILRLLGLDRLLVSPRLRIDAARR